MRKFHFIKSKSLFNFSVWSVIFAANVLRFIGLEKSPPGFYMDEAFGAVQALCIQLSGNDFLGNHLPLFTVNSVGNVYTPAFLYGEVLWTYIFGNSVFGFRSFIGFVTTLSIFFLYLFVKNRVGARTALWVALSASIMPWSFIFSRIAWDPPLAALFISAFLWATTFKNFNWISGVFLALSAYSYPPMRLMAPIFLILLPGINLKRKLLILLVAGIMCIPLAWYMLTNPDFMIRSHMMAIWGPFYGNPYRNYEFYELLKVIGKNILSHMSFDFLFLHGERSLRGSIQAFGMLSWLDLFALLICPLILIWKKFQNKEASLFSREEKCLIYVGLLGAILSCVPSSLTHEGIPNAVRSLPMWLFFAILSGVLIGKFLESAQFSFVYVAPLLIGAIFFLAFIKNYFFVYPLISKEAFQLDYFTAYTLPKVQSGNAKTCDNIRDYFEATARPEVLVGEKISFADSNQSSSKFLWNNWYEKEAWGVWSNGKKASLHFPRRDKPSDSVELELKGLVTAKNPNQAISIKINGETEVIDALSSIPQSFKVPIKNPNSNNLVIEIQTPNAVSPVQAGFANGDNRKLGVGLISVKFN